MNISSLGKLPNRKKVLKTFRNFISKERHNRISISSACCHYFDSLFTRLYRSLSQYDFYGNRNYEFFKKKNTKIVIHALERN